MPSFPAVLAFFLLLSRFFVIDLIVPKPSKFFLFFSSLRNWKFCRDGTFIFSGLDPFFPLTDQPYSISSLSLVYFQENSAGIGSISLQRLFIEVSEKGKKEPASFRLRAPFQTASVSSRSLQLPGLPGALPRRRHCPCPCPAPLRPGAVPRPRPVLHVPHRQGAALPPPRGQGEAGSRGNGTRKNQFFGVRGQSAQIGEKRSKKSEERTSLHVCRNEDLLFALVPLQEVLAYDPAFSGAEVDILKTLGVRLLEKNTSGAFKVSSEETATLALLPHCPKELSSNLLESNWSPRSLRRLFLVANSFDRICSSLPDRLVSSEAPYVLKALPFVREAPIDNCYKHKDVFNDLSLHSFPVRRLI